MKPNWAGLIVVLLMLAFVAIIAYAFYSTVLPVEYRSMPVLVLLMSFIGMAFLTAIVASSIYKTSRDTSINQMGEIELGVYIAQCMQSYRKRFSASNVKFRYIAELGKRVKVRQVRAEMER